MCTYFHHRSVTVYSSNLKNKKNLNAVFIQRMLTLGAELN